MRAVPDLEKSSLDHEVHLETSLTHWMLSGGTSLSNGSFSILPPSDICVLAFVKAVC